MCAPCRFLTRRLHRNDEKNPKIWCARWRKLKGADLQRGTKCYMRGYREKERGECGVSDRPGLLKEDKVPVRQKSPVTPPSKQASYPDPSGTGGLALSRKSRCHSRGLRHAATCLCLYVQLCVKVFSLTLCICVCQFPYSFFRRCFFKILLFKLLNSDSSEWRKWKQGWVSNLSRFWVQTEIWHWRPRQILVYLFIR